MTIPTFIGLKVVQHGGGTFGFITQFVFFPELKRGIVVLTNSRQGGLLMGPVYNRILELWFAKDLKSSETLASLLDTTKSQEDVLRKGVCPISEDVGQRLLGKHYNEELGEIIISNADNGYRIHLGGYTYPLSGFDDPSGANKIILSGENPIAGIAFQPVLKGEITLRLELGQELYSFKRMATQAIYSIGEQQA